MTSTTDLLDGRYRLVRLLGQGGMSDVYEAIDERSDTAVAIKFVRSADPELARRFAQEVRALGRVEHPGLVRLIGTGLAGDHAYLVMELVQGSTLAEALQGTTGEVVISFAQIYRKTARNMALTANEFDFSWREHNLDDPTFLAVARDLATELAHIAASCSMQLRVCSQKAFLQPGLIEEARCVDAERLERVAGRPILNKTRQKGNRKECACSASRDIGEYDTCPHGCVYCYAVQHRDLALQRYKAHDPHGEFLFPPIDLPTEQAQDASQIIAPATVRRSRQHNGPHPTSQKEHIGPQQGTLF